MSSTCYKNEIFAQSACVGDILSLARSKDVISIDITLLRKWTPIGDANIGAKC